MATVSRRVQVEELKKYVQPESRELFYFVGIFRTPSLRDSIPVAPGKLLQGGRRESQAIYVCNKGSRQSEHQTSGIKLRMLMLKVKLQYFGHLMQTADSLVKSLTLGKIDGGRRRGCWRTRWLDGTTDAMDMSLGKLREMVRGRDG